jgi:hypothetical protein
VDLCLRSKRERIRRSALVVACAFVAAIAASACGDGLPPQAGGLFPDAGDEGNGDDAPDFGFDSGLGPHDCNLGPDHGVCTCVDMQVLADIPNLYFVLDRSGSMSLTAPNAPAGAPTKWETVVNVVAHAVSKLGPRINVAAAVFPDWATAGNTCTPGSELVGLRHGDSPAGSLTGSTYKAFIGELLQLSPNGGTPTAATLEALLPKMKTLPGRTYVILATDGGPNCNANTACTVDQCIVNIESSAPGCAPLTAPNCCDPGKYGPLNCLDSAATIAAVNDYTAATIPVYVIGVPGSGPYSALLDQLAQAGGTARSSSPYYYRVDGYDEASFQSALFQVAAKIVASCTLKLGSVPQDPTKVNVFFDGTVVPQDGPDGWTLVGDTVTLLGASCDKVLSGAVLDVNISGGCPTVLH